MPPLAIPNIEILWSTEFPNRSAVFKTINGIVKTQSKLIIAVKDIEKTLSIINLYEEKIYISLDQLKEKITLQMV